VSQAPVDIPEVTVERRTHRWTPQTDHTDFADIDIGLLPLEDSEHDRGKSPFKLLQYCAAGCAVIATPVAIDSSILKPGVCFLPARSEDEWLTSMTRLVDDAALRAQLGRAAREAVVANYSFESHAPAFLDALFAAARGPV
jgi:glycosyltransferase involved in cell wall biosynthesis